LPTDKAHDFFVELNKLEKQNLLNQEATYADYQDALSRIVRRFYDNLIGQDIKHETVIHKISNLKYSARVRKILSAYYDLLIELETKENLALEDLLLQTEQFRQRLISMTPLSKKIATRAVEEIEPHQINNFIATKHLLYNATLALQFQEIELAKRKYNEALALYNALDSKQQDELYLLTHLVFDDLLYVASYTRIH
jgi:hypothetical protein